MTLVAYTKIGIDANIDALWNETESAFSGAENRGYFDEIRSRKNQDSIKESLCALLVLAELLKSANLPSKDLIFARQESGKPYFINSKIEFSLSHSHGYAAAIISNESHVGIDLEAATLPCEKAEKLARRFFSESELDEFATTPESFLNIWTKKEAFAKMQGIPLSDLITAEKKSPLATKHNVFFSYFNVDGHPLTVCLENPCEIKNLGEITV